MKTILCWAMVIGAILALASPIIANILVAWHERKEAKKAIEFLAKKDIKATEVFDLKKVLKGMD